MSSLPLTFRLLQASDGAQYQQLRLEALQHDPEAFYATFESEQLRHEQAFQTELDISYNPPYFGYYGAFFDQQLIGFCQVNRSYLPKQSHVAFIYNLYLSPKYRGQGLAGQLLSHILSQLKAHEHTQVVYLSVLAKNQAARRFYQHFGFKRCGIKPRSAFWQNAYDDEIELVLFLK